MTRTHRQQAADFAQWLKEQQACPNARRWARGKTLQEAWERCPVVIGRVTSPGRSWLVWLLMELLQDKAITKSEEARLWKYTNYHYRDRRRGELDRIKFIDVEVST